jgi:putative Holliday junction resolvase
MRVLALDFGTRRTGVALSDETGTLARPLTVVDRAAAEAGLAEIARLVLEHAAELVLVGMPVTLGGEHGEQARTTDAFVSALRPRLAVPVETYDERFTTTLAQQTPSRAPEDARAAAHLLQSWLDRRARR